MNAWIKGALALGSTGLVVGGLSLGGAVAQGGQNLSPSTDRPTQLAPRAVALPRVYAVVKANGDKARGKGVNATSRLEVGTYDVRFDRRIGTCAWLGTVAKPGFTGSTGPGYVTITGRNGTRNGLYVQTYNGAGDLANLPFHVLVVCR